jgi:hypothetical protein
MAFASAGYREYEGARGSAWRACWPIVRTGLGMILRRKLFWGLIGLGLLNFLFNFALIYLKATLSVQNKAVAGFLDNYRVTGTGQAFADFMMGQASITALLLAFAGSALIGNDYRQGGLAFYLSRRIDRRHYVAGKLLTVGGVVTIITTIPALLLFGEYGVLSNSLAYFLDNPQIARGIVGYGLVLAVVQSLILFAIAAWVPRTVPLVTTWLGVFVLLKGLAEAARAIDDDRRWLLLGLWDDMHQLGNWCFGSLDPSRTPSVEACAAALAIVCGLCLGLILWRVRAVEVVR